MRAAAVAGLLAAAAIASCGDGDGGPPAPRLDLAGQREAMVAETIEARNVQDERVLAAMRKVPRHEFVPEGVRRHAYEDRALPIGYGQAVSQPFLVALMAEVADIGAGERVLEIGTGSGYGAAVLAELARDVFTIEIVEPLAEQATATLARLGYENVHVRAGDGYRGWPEAAPFDAIIVTAAPPEVPEPLKKQLRVGGNLVCPVGTHRQYLRVLTRTPEGFVEHPLFEVDFVPMAGEAQREAAGRSGR